MARILIVEDHDEMREVLREALLGEGHEVIEATDGATAVRLYVSDPVDLIILDILLPEKDGMEVMTG